MAVQGFENLGVGVDGTTSTAETLELAKDADALGFHSFWLSEGYHTRSAVVRATVIATSTNRIRIGLGILSPHTKHPALLAMEAASLDELARGRVIVCVGRVLNALRKQGLEQAGTTQLVKESIDLIRGFLSGQLVQYNGTRFSIPEPGSRLGDWLVSTQTESFSTTRARRASSHTQCPSSRKDSGSQAGP